MKNQLTVIVDFNNPKWVPNKSYAVPLEPSATVHDALRAVYDVHHKNDPSFTFDVRYSGQLGSFLQTLCGVPTTISTSWEIFIGDEPAENGLDTVLTSMAEPLRFLYVLDKDEFVGAITATAKRSRTL